MNPSSNPSKKLKGLRANIYRVQDRECSNGGISSRCHVVTLIGQAVPEIFEADTEAPPVKLVRRQIHPDQPPYVHAEPLLPAGESKWFQWGGTLIDSSDSRFRSAVGHPYAISLHDRTE